MKRFKLILTLCMVFSLLLGTASVSNAKTQKNYSKATHKLSATTHKSAKSKQTGSKHVSKHIAKKHAKTK